MAPSGHRHLCIQRFLERRVTGERLCFELMSRTSRPTSNGDCVSAQPGAETTVKHTVPTGHIRSENRQEIPTARLRVAKRFALM
eukprot:3248108-Rhodomonas_salina.1